MTKNYKKMMAMIWILVLVCTTFLGCGSKKNDSNSDSKKGGKVELTFSIWDTNQKAGMEAMAAAFTEQNPDITVKVEVTPWDQYWTKLQAAASGSNMPDIFWMHPEQIYNYVEGNALMDLTQRIQTEGIDLSKFPEFVTGDFNIEEKQYGIPKDYSTIGLWYNKDLFDKAGVSYPDDTWTWDTWMDAAEKLTNKEEGIYGMLAPCNSQNFFYNLIWQNGSDIINKEETDSLFDDEKTIEAIKYGVSFIEKGYSPTTADMANTTPDQYFESGKAAMVTAGSWMSGEYTSIDGLNCDVAPLPKNIQRGSVCGGMGYSIAAKAAHPEEAWKFVQYLGGMDANKIQAESGAAIPAFEGSQEPWVKGFPSIHAQVFVDASEYGYSSQYCRSRRDWLKLEEQIITQIFAGNLGVEEGCKQLADEVQAILNENK